MDQIDELWIGFSSTLLFCVAHLEIRVKRWMVLTETQWYLPEQVTF